VRPFQEGCQRQLTAIHRKKGRINDDDVGNSLLHDHLIKKGKRKGVGEIKRQMAARSVILREGAGVLYECWEKKRRGGGSPRLSPLLLACEKKKCNGRHGDSIFGAGKKKGGKKENLLLARKEVSPFNPEGEKGDGDRVSSPARVTLSSRRGKENEEVHRKLCASKREKRSLSLFFTSGGRNSYFNNANRFSRSRSL